MIIGRCTGTAKNSRDTMVSEVNVLQREAETSPSLLMAVKADVFDKSQLLSLFAFFLLFH